MARKAKGTGKIRAQMEASLLSMADINECLPLMRLRIEQAIRRAGLGELLSPALDDIKRMQIDVADAQSQVRTAITQLVGE